MTAQRTASADATLRASGITAIVPAYTRVDQTLATLSKLQQCDPAPSEIIVHVDGNQKGCANSISRAFPDIRVLFSEKNLGPGNARNKLVAAANTDIVASFDDDSFPVDSDYFERVRIVFDEFPDAAIVLASVFHIGEALAESTKSFEWVADFIGCGCVYRRSVFLAMDGYVPVPIAYGMEEVDLALRLHAQGQKILWTPWLRVFHDTQLLHHSLPAITAASIANLALLGYLRYPPSSWLRCLGQCLNRIFWLLKHGRWRGIVMGILMVPGHLRKYRAYRNILPASAIQSHCALRKAAISAESFE